MKRFREFTLQTSIALGVAIGVFLCLLAWFTLAV